MSDSARRELMKLVDVLNRLRPTPDEAEVFGPTIPSTMTAGWLAEVRAILRRHHARLERVEPNVFAVRLDSDPDYGPPKWADLLRQYATERQPWWQSGSTILKAPTSDPKTAPAASALALERAIAELPPSKRRRDR